MPRAFPGEAVGGRAGAPGIWAPRGRSAFISTIPSARLLRGWRFPLPPAALRSGCPASPALFTAVPDVQHLGAPVTWERKYLLFLPRTHGGDSQVTLPRLC